MSLFPFRVPVPARRALKLAMVLILLAPDGPGAPVLCMAREPSGRLSVALAALVFAGIPFAVTGGVLSPCRRGMHLSMSAGVGFIAVFGVAGLNGIALLAFVNPLRGRVGKPSRP